MIDAKEAKNIKEEMIELKKKLYIYSSICEMFSKIIFKK